MKTILTSLIITLISLTSYSQEKKDIIIELPGTQSELYTQTKMYISEHYNMSEVLENDDSESKILFIRPLMSESSSENFGMVNVSHYFRYTIKWYHKDGKVRMITELSPVSDKVISSPYSNSWLKLNISNEFQGLMKTGISKKGFYNIKNNILKKYSNLPESYTNYMKNNKVQLDDW